MDGGISLADLIEFPERGIVVPFPVKEHPQAKKRNRCTFCQEVGHNRRTCIKRPKCGICRKMGHDRRTCPSNIMAERKIYRERRRFDYPKRVDVRQRNCNCGRMAHASCVTFSCKRHCISKRCPAHPIHEQPLRRPSLLYPILQNGSESSFVRFKGVFTLLLAVTILGLIFGDDLANLLAQAWGGIGEGLSFIWSGFVFIWNIIVAVGDFIVAVFEFIWNCFVFIWNIIVAVGDFIVAVFEFVLLIVEIIYEIIKFIVLIVVAIVCLILWLVYSILAYVIELLAWIF